MIHLHKGEHDEANHVHIHTHEHEHEHEHDEIAEGKDMEVLAKLITHWIDHNVEHERSYLEWAEKAAQNNKADSAEAIRRAVAIINKANEELKQASDALK